MASELFKPAVSIEVRGHTFDQIQGTDVPRANLPFKKGHISRFSQAVIKIDANPEEQADLFQVSSIHKRSFEVATGASNAIFFVDEFGNLFTKINTKGNMATHPHLYRYNAAPSRMMIFGMQDSDSMVRALRASEVMRAAGIETEMIFKVTEPQELPFGEELTSLSEYKNRLAQGVWDDNAQDGDKCPETDESLMSRKNHGYAVLKLQDMTLFFTARALQVSTRLSDFREANSREDLQKILEDTFRYINMSEQLHAVKDKSYKPQYFSVDSIQDKINYYLNYLPAHAAMNFARMHKLGLIHIFPHSGNVTTVGSIVDLDSVRGEVLSLGDPPVTRADTIKDVKEFLYGNSDWTPPYAIIADLLGRNLIDLELTLRINFLQKYIKEMGWEGDIERLKDIEELYKNPKNEMNYFSYVRDDYLRSIEERYEIQSVLPSPKELAVFAATKLPVPGGDTQGQGASELQNQLIFLYRTCMGILRENLERSFEDQGLNAQVSQEMLEVFVNYYFDNFYYKLQAEYSGIKYRPKKEKKDLGKQYKEQRSDFMRRFEFEFYHDLFKAWGWEENVLPHIEALANVYWYDGVAKESSEVEWFLNHYLDPLLEQSGWDYKFDIPPEELTIEFEEEDLERAKRIIKRAFLNSRKKGAAIDTQDALEDILNTPTRRRHWSPSPDDRFRHFLDDKMSPHVWDKLDAEMPKVEETFGKNAALYIVILICEREMRRIFDEIPDETYENMIKTVSQRVEDVKNSYISKVVTT